MTARMKLIVNVSRGTDGGRCLLVYSTKILDSIEQSREDVRSAHWFTTKQYNVVTTIKARMGTAVSEC